MASVYDSLAYPEYALMDVAAPDKWVKAPGYGSFQGCYTMAVKGVGRYAGSAAVPCAYWNPTHTAFGPDQYSMASHAVPMDTLVNGNTVRHDLARNAFYCLFNIFQAANTPWGYDEQGAVQIEIFRFDELGQTLIASASMLHAMEMTTAFRAQYPGALCVGDHDYWRLDVWGSNPVKLRASIVQGGGGGVLDSTGSGSAPAWYYGTYYKPTAHLGNWQPPESPIVPYGPTPTQCAANGWLHNADSGLIWQSPVYEDSSPNRILSGQPGLFGADTVNTVDPSATNCPSSFFAGDADWLSAEVKSRTGTSAVIGGYKPSGRLVQVT
jgi:hypothetical protein